MLKYNLKVRCYQFWLKDPGIASLSRPGSYFKIIIYRINKISVCVEYNENEINLRTYRLQRDIFAIHTMHSSANHQSPPTFAVFNCLCDTVDHNQEVRFLLN